MTAPPYCCPYCNAVVAIPADTRVGQRVPCPRCGEAFPFRGAPAEGEADWASAFSSEPPAPAPLSTQHSALSTQHSPRRWSNRAVAWTLLGVMAVMAAVGLTYMLWSQDIRRGHDASKPPKSEVIAIPLGVRFALGLYLFALAFVLARSWFQRVRTTAAEAGTRPGWRRFLLPGVLTALGAVLVVLVLQTRRNPEPESELIPVRVVPPGELAGLRYLPDDVNLVAGVHVAEALEKPAGKELLSSFRAGPLNLGIDTFARWTGLPAEDLDHVVLGLDMTDEWVPPMTFVIRTRRPYDPDKVTIDKLPLKPVVWTADRRTLVVFVNVKENKVKALQDRPPAGTDHLPGPVREFLQDRERLGEGTQAWLVGHPAGWDPKAPWAALLVQRLEKDDQAAAKAVRTFGAWLRLGEEVTWGAAFQTADADALKERLDKQFPAGHAAKSEAWVTVGGKTTADALRQALGQVNQNLGGR